MRRLFKAGCCSLIGLMTTAVPAIAASAVASNATATLTVTVVGVRNAKGQVVVTLCRAGEEFPGGCSMRRQSPATQGRTTVAFSSLPPGNYAVALFHDEDGDGKLTFIKEGIGFSNDANVAYGAPKFSLSSFAVANRPKTITVNIKYLS